MLGQSNGQTIVRNAILSKLSLPDFATIRPLLHSVVLKERMILHEPKKRVEHVHFIESGIVSLRTLAAGSILETAMVGCRGAVGVSVVLGGHVTIHQSIVLFPGSALIIHSEDLHRVLGECPQIRSHLLRYVQTLIVHGAQTALCGVCHDLEQRLACWLCLACDALDGRVLPITHDCLSTVLGLRRAGVTEALIRFEEQGLIRKMRGVLQVDDRQRLEQVACSCYGIIANSYVAPKATHEKLAEVSP